MFQIKRSTLGLHVVCGLLFLSLPVIFMSGQPGDRNIVHFLLSPSYWYFVATFFFIYYLNTYYLIPSFYLNKKILLYFFIIALLFIAVYFLQPFDHLVSNSFLSRGDQPRPEPFDGGPGFPGRPGPPPRGNGPQRSGGPQKTDIVSIVLFIMVWSLGMAVRIMEQWRGSEQRAVRAEADKANAELSFLKAQINPHFLFNTLNNIYSMAIMQHENTADSILKLSHIMRFVTDDMGKHFVPLQNEVDCVADYIELQRLRLKAKTIVDFSVSGNFEGHMIPPLILMTFVENVFKYGVSSRDPSPITITLDTTKDSIVFSCRNKLFDRQPGLERSGIGIVNAKKRLNYLYQGRYSLIIADDDGFFTIRLTIQS